MTEYELLEIYSNTFNAWIMLFTSYISIVFAFLVAATLGVDKMNSVLSALAVTLFSMTALFFIVLTSIVGIRVVEQIADVSAITGDRGAGAAWLLAALVSAIMILTYLGSVFFFFYHRRMNRHAVLGDS
jgi:hypothetical protein